MGAPISASFVATHAEIPVKNYIDMAGPIDFSKVGLFGLWLKKEYFDVDRVVDTLGSVPADLVRAGFKLIRPTIDLSTGLNLWWNLWNDTYVESFQALNRWANEYVAFPGEFFRQWVRHFYQDNKLYRRELGIRGRPLRLLPREPPAATPPDPTVFWRPVLDQGLQTWAKLFGQAPATPELLTQWKQFLDQWIEAWSKILGQAMGTEQFAKLMGQSLDQVLVLQAPFRKAAEQHTEQALQALGLPSRNQVTAVAKQIVELEERIERLEDRIDAVLRRLGGKEPT